MTFSLRITIKHSVYYLMLTIIFLFVVLRNIIEVQIPIETFLVLGFVLCLMCDKEEIVAYICSMASFEMTFQYRYMILIGLVFLIIKNRKNNPKFILPVLVIIIWEFMHFESGDIEFINGIKQFASLIALGVVMMQTPIDYSDGLPMRSLSITTLFSCIITVFVSRNITGYSLSTGDRLGGTYETFESFDAMLNPNVGAFLCVLSICGLLLLWKDNNKTGLDVFLIVSLSFFVILFQSKSALISLVFAIIISIYANNVNWIVSTLKILGLVLLLSIVAFFLFREIIVGFIERFLVKDISTGRLSIFAFYHNYIMSNKNVLLFGNGLFEYNIRIAKHYSNVYLAAVKTVAYVDNRMVVIVSHNSIQEIILAWGLVGIAMFVWLLVFMIKHKKMKRNNMNYLALEFVLLYTLQGQLFSSGVALLALLFSMVCMEFAGKEKEDNGIEIIGERTHVKKSVGLKRLLMESQEATNESGKHKKELSI